MQLHAESTHVLEERRKGASGMPDFSATCAEGAFMAEALAIIAPVQGALQRARAEP
jgi:hypothetical protein